MKNLPNNPIHDRAVQAVLDSLGRQRRILLSLPAGIGYHAIALRIAAALPEKSNVLVLTDRKETAIDFRYVASSFPAPTPRIDTAPYDRISNPFVWPYDTILLLGCEQMPLRQLNNAVFQQHPKIRIIGIDSSVPRSREFFGPPVYRCSIDDAIAARVLTPYRIARIAVPFDPASLHTETDAEALAAKLLETVANAKSLVVCNSILDARMLTEALNRIAHREVARTLTYDTESQRDAVNRFGGRAETLFLIVVNMRPELPQVRKLYLLDRFDDPDRKQEMIGRYLRPWHDKKELRVFEFVTEASQDKNGTDRHRPAKTPITYRDRKSFRGVMGVGDLAEELAESILRIPCEQGCMIGIFGQWGRGKTFLFEETFRVLQRRESIRRVDFHAWKYQETPASWAYLYEQFAHAYYDSARSRCERWTRRMRLNLSRLGGWRIALFLGSVAVSLLLLRIPLADKLRFGTGIAAFLGISLLGLLLLWIRYRNPAISLFREYCRRTSYVQVLGMQAEIQKELHHLLDAWARYEASLKIVLFVDDMDRCDEEKLLRLADSLRVMLDDERLSQRIVVVTAVDDRLLKRAIRRKYADNDSTTIVAEYMDKLFLAGIRLGALDESEKAEFFDELVRRDIDLTSECVSVPAPASPPEESLQSVPTSPAPMLPDESPIAQADASQTAEPSRFADDTPRLTPEEVAGLKSELARLGDVTPRQMRIYYYRYLTAKNLLIRQYARLDRPCYWLTETNLPLFLRLLSVLSGHDGREAIERERERLKSAAGSAYTVGCLEETTTDRLEFRRLLRVLDIAVGY